MNSVKLDDVVDRPEAFASKTYVAWGDISDLYQEAAGSWGLDNFGHLLVDLNSMGCETVEDAKVLADRQPYTGDDADANNEIVEVILVARLRRVR